MMNLDVRREQHNAKSGAHSPRRKVLSELSADKSVGSVSAGDAAPDASVAGSVLLVLGLVDVCDALTEVERSLLGGVDTLNLTNRGVTSLLVKGHKEATELGLGVQTHRLLFGGLCCLGFAHFQCILFR